MTCLPGFMVYQGLAFFGASRNEERVRVPVACSQTLLPSLRVDSWQCLAACTIQLQVGSATAQA